MALSDAELAAAARKEELQRVGVDYVRWNMVQEPSFFEPPEPGELQALAIVRDQFILRCINRLQQVGFIPEEIDRQIAQGMLYDLMRPFESQNRELLSEIRRARGVC